MSLRSRHMRNRLGEISTADSDLERLTALEQLESWLERPMLVLSFVWLVLVLVELVGGSSLVLEVFGVIVWIIFIIEFGVRLALAPRKGAFLAENWVTVIALVVPALRLLRGIRILRLARGVRGLKLVKVIGTANRGMNALAASLGRQGIGYVLAATLIVNLLGAAGMLAFEPAAEVDGGFESYGDALWWTSMLITTMGSQFWPHTVEGRILCLLLSLYGLAVFGYITASLASFFVGRRANERQGTDVGRQIESLRADLAGLRQDLRRSAHSPAPEPEGGT